MASIYDSYQIANSQQARPYIGNNLTELREVGNEMQRRYDTAVGNMDNIDMLARQITTDPKSDAALQETLAGVRSRLQEYAQRPDKENLIRPTSLLARDFAADAQTFMGNVKAMQDYRDEIDKRDDVDRNTKEQTKALAQVEYQGLRRDPATGRLVNPFRGSYNPPKSIDATAFVNKVGEGIKADAGGSAVRQVSGDYYVEVAGEWKKVSPERVASITKNLIDSDPEMQAYLDYQGLLAGKGALYSGKVRSIEDIPNTDIDVRLADGSKSKVNLRQRVQDYMAKNNVTAAEAAANLESANRKQSIVNDLTNAAIGKFAFQEKSSSRKVMGETEAATRTASEPLRFMITAPSNVATGELQGMDMSDLQTRIEDTDKSIVGQQGLVAQLIRNNAAPSDIQTAQNQLRSLQDQRLAAQSVRENTRNEAARQMGFKNYDDYVARDVSGKVRTMVDKTNLNNIGAQAYDAAGNPIAGRGISKDQLTTALQNGLVKTVNPGTGIPGDSYYEVPTADGTVRIPTRSGDSQFEYLMYNVKNDVFGSFDKKTKQLFKDSKNLNYSTHQINIGEKDGSEVLAQMYKADPNAFTVYDRKGEPITDQDDLPQDLKLSSINVVKGGNGSVMLQGYREEKDKHGNVTDKEYFTIVPNPNNNVGSQIGQRLLKDANKMTNKNDKEDITRSAVTMMGDQWDGILSQAANNENLPIRDAFGNNLGYIRKERNEANPKSIVYRMYNNDNQRAYRQDPNGMLTDIATTDITKAANWVRGIVENANKAKSQ